MIISSTPMYSFISTGEKTAMYTLKTMSKVVGVNPFGVREYYNDSFYIQNLSTDKQTAVDKANSLSAAMGIPFRDNADFDLNEIKRRKAGEVKAEQEAREKAHREYEAKMADEFQSEVDTGFMVCGKHMGKTAQETVDAGDIDYVLYCASQFVVDSINMGAWRINCAICSQWLSENPQPVSDYVGVVGSVLEEKVTVKRVSVCNGRFYTVMFLCVTAEGNLIKFFTTAKAFNDTERGDVFTVKGNVKEHAKDHYVDGSPKVTMINRPKMVK
jgi:hypothetical protein